MLLERNFDSKINKIMHKLVTWAVLGASCPSTYKHGKPVVPTVLTGTLDKYISPLRATTAVIGVHIYHEFLCHLLPPNVTQTWVNPRTYQAKSTSVSTIFFLKALLRLPNGLSAQSNCRLVQMNSDASFLYSFLFSREIEAAFTLL